jgi:hypothetical protein
MKNLLYKIKNKFYRISNEASKIEKPIFEELKEFKSFQRGPNNKFILSFGAGRSGQNWFSKIFNSHTNWVGTCERFAEFEAFYRYICFYNLPIDKSGMFQLLKLASNRDLSKYQNTFIASPYFSFGVNELNSQLKPNYLFFHIRDPIKCVESFYAKGWYSNIDTSLLKKGPMLNELSNLRHNFSRILPKDDYFNQWLKLTRIGKITWFWSIINKSIFDDFSKNVNSEKFFIRLEDVDQNYGMYQKLSEKFNFQNKMNKQKFYNVIYKAPNKGLRNKHEYKEWNKLEKQEFKSIIENVFPHYDSIKTNL